MLRLGDHPALAGPGFPRLVTQLLEDAGGMTGQAMELGRVVEFLADGSLEPAVAGEPQNRERRVMRFTEGHEWIATESRVASDDDTGLWPARADALVEERHELDHTPCAVLISGPEDRGKQVMSREGVEGEKTVFIVEAVEEAALLITVEGVVGGVEIDDDLVGRDGIGIQEGIDEELPDLSLVPLDALVAIRFAGLPSPQFEPVQGALTGQRIGVAIAAADDAEQGIGTPQVVVVKILIALTQAIDPLREQILDRMRDQILTAMIKKTTRK